MKRIPGWTAAAALAACAIHGQPVLACEEEGQHGEAPSGAEHTPSSSTSDLPEALRAQATRGPDGDTSSAYVDPEKARRLSERIHEEVRDAAAIGRRVPR